MLNYALLVRNPLDLRSMAVLDPACVSMKEEVSLFVNARQTPDPDVARLPRTMIEFVAEQECEFSRVELHRLFSGRLSSCRDPLRRLGLLFFLGP